MRVALKPRMKFVKVFSLESFPLYGIILVLVNHLLVKVH